MAITPVSVAVPVSGLGPVASIATLVGPKTVQLSGTFVGYYDLLASHDDVDFVAVASFNASGPEGVKLTISGAFKSVRLRSGAVAITLVTCEVSGTAAAGENGFGTIATLAAGFSGLTPVVDTSTIVAPTGSESDTNFICQGDFQGAIVVLGSADGVAFNPIGEFRVDRRPEGAPAVVELAPLVTETKLRYVRLQVPAALTGAVVVTMGGRLPAAGGGGGGTPMDIFVARADGTVFQGLGSAIVSTLGPSSVAVGPDNSIDPTSNQFVIVVGTNNYLGQSSNSVLIVGPNNAVGNDNPNLCVVGSSNVFYNSSVGSVGFGYANEAHFNAANSLIFGRNNLVQETAGGPAIVVGAGNTMGSQHGIIVGSACSTHDNSLDNFLFGYECHIISDNANHNILVGHDITTNGQDDTILVGRNITVDQSTGRNIVFGASLTLNAGAENNLIMSTTGTTTDLANSRDNVILGNDHTAGQNDQHITLVGDHLAVANDVEQIVMVGNNMSVADSFGIRIGGGLTTGTNTGASVILSFNSSLGNDSNNSVLIHNSNVGLNSNQALAIRGTIGDNSPNCVAVAGGSIGTVGGTGSPDNVVVGFSTMDDGVSSSIIIGGINGGSNSIDTNSHDVIVIGQNSHSGTGSSYVVAMGTNVNVVAPSSHLVAIGDSLNITGLANSVVIGQQISLNSVGTSDNVIIGNSIAFSDGTFGIGVAIGWSITVNENGQGIVIGPNTVIGNATYGVAIGPAAQVVAVDSTKWCLALGAYAVAAGGEAIIGHSDGVSNPSPAVHLFAVRGYNGGDLDTISAIDNPDDGSTGLAVVYNTGGTFSNKTVKAAASPPVGSLLLYVDP